MAEKTSDPRSLLRAAARHVRVRAPDLAFAGRFLTRDRRLPVYTVASVLGVLHDVMNHQDAPGEACESETPEQKRAVCATILDFLYSGQKTGKPELDGFADVAGRFGVARAALEGFADGLATRVTTARYATWVRLRRDRMPIAAGAAGVLAAVLAPQPGRPPAPEAVKRLADGALAAALTDDLRRLAGHWRQGRLTVALEDLVASGLSEADLRRFDEARSAGGDPRWRTLVDRLGRRIVALHEQSQTGWAALEPSCQRALAIWALAQRDQLARWLAAGGDPFAIDGEQRESAWRRLARLPAAVRLLAKVQVRGGKRKK